MNSSNIDFTLRGLTCAACVKLSSKKIAKLPGVQAVDIDLATGAARLIASRPITLAEINQVLNGTDYRAVSQ